MLHADQLDQLIVFQRRTGATDAAGNHLPGAWVERARAWFKYRPDYSREKVQQGRLHAKYVATANTYRDPVIDTITPEMRAVLLAGPYSGPMGATTPLTAAVRTVTFESPTELSVILEIGAEP